MTDNKTCPSCGATLENNVGSQCPFCGAALATVSSSAQTLISRPLSKKGEFENSAEAMDEVKRLVREGESEAAEQVASEQFDLKPEDAHSTVEQVEVDMKYSGEETKLAGQVVPPMAAAAAPGPAYTPPASQAVYNTPPAASSTEPEKSSKRNWIIGGSIGAAIFLCLCCCLPLLIFGINAMRNR
jgi:uncharacterized Zn finger protein (UPF0148 family)